MQPMDDASPPKWHLAHTTWFFETFLLKPFPAGYRPFDERYEYLFNSYYNGVGEPYPRPRRGMLSRPTVAEVYDYRRHVDEAMGPLLESDDPEVRARLELGLHHEQQHQELLVTDIKYTLGSNPLMPAYRDDLRDSGAEAPAAGASGAPGYVAFAGGIVQIGAPDPALGDFCFDNERPRHQAMLRPFALADRLVTNGEFLAFIEDGGYTNPDLWLSDGWAALAGVTCRGSTAAIPAPPPTPAPCTGSGAALSGSNTGSPARPLWRGSCLSPM
ncbi:MAG: SUMF1/EgtB/PvdO family nonheme iron enzyme [Gammaproteobacteria bacterium]|nr:SUMF1/EgtB/PvdO family nonheme iron enzyme [Gammaproteobacteria bacterium]